jgi:CRP-like cAMP-binding protein
MPTPHNALLDPLPRRERQRLLAGCEPVELVRHVVLAEAGAALGAVWFPLQGFVAQLLPAGVGGGPGGLAVGMVGPEGMVGATLALGVAAAPVRSVVQGAGSAWCVGAERFGQEVRAGGALSAGVRRYLFVTVVQLGTGAGCQRDHALGPRLARWLLMCDDRSRAGEIRLTHEALGQLLGVRRVGVTVAARGLQGAGIIDYQRGALRVLDRPALEAHACACYRADLGIHRALLRR